MTNYKLLWVLWGVVAVFWSGLAVLWVVRFFQWLRRLKTVTVTETRHSE